MANYKVIGIHKSYDETQNINIGTNIKVIFENFGIKYSSLLNEYKINLNIDIAIDYTASNGPITDSKSNHYLSNEILNDYEKAIMKFCKILLLKKNKMNEQSFKVYGFGGIPPNSKNVSHCFNINFGKNEDIIGIDNVLKTYKKSLTKIKFSGNTKMHYILKSVIDRIKKDLIIKNNEKN